MRRYIFMLLLLLSGGSVSLAQREYTPPPPPPWDGTTRYTVLVMGMDRRPAQASLLDSRADVMILASFDPATRAIGIFHIPRDLYVPLPGRGTLARVNTLSILGEDQMSGYGPYYAAETISRSIGLSIDAFVVFDFTSFITLVDAMGGIEMDIPYSISDTAYPDMNFGFDPFFIGRGRQVLDGATALAYARTRHGDNDYVRGQRQMAVMQAVFNRLRDPAALQGMLGQAPALVAQLRTNLYTNVPFEQLTFLGLVALEMTGDIRTGGFNEANTRLFPGPGGQVRVPRVEMIPEALAEAFGETYWN